MGLSSPQVDRTKLSDLNEYSRSHDVAAPGFLRLFHGSREFMVSQPWVARIKNILVGRIYPYQAAVFLFEILPRSKGIDRQLWVVWGDVPPAYLVLDRAKDPDGAVRAYMSEVRRWMSDARAGEFRHDTMPVSWPTDPPSLDTLESLLTDVFAPTDNPNEGVETDA